MIVRVKNIVIEATYNDYYNLWFATASTRTACLFKNRRLREGVYPLYNELNAHVDYLGRNPSNQSIESASINFLTPCQVTNIGVNPCV